MAVRAPQKAGCWSCHYVDLAGCCAADRDLSDVLCREWRHQNEGGDMSNDTPEDDAHREETTTMTAEQQF